MATDKHSEYIILSPPPPHCNSGSADVLQCYIYTYIACLLFYYLNERKHLGEISTVSFSPVVYLSHTQNITEYRSVKLQRKAASDL